LPSIEIEEDGTPFPKTALRRSAEILNGCLGRLGLRLSRVNALDALTMIRFSAGALINGCLGVFGLRVSRVHNPDAIRDPAVRAIAKGLSTRQYNTPESMDAFYTDPHLMTHYFTHDRLAFYPAVCDHLTRLNIRPVDVLDVGCGSGHLLAALQQVFPEARLHGIDSSPEAIRLAHHLNPAFWFETVSIFDLEELGRQFDLVLCTEVLEHLEAADVAIRRLLGVCRPGGTMVITVPDGRRDTFAGHFNFWTPESFRREFNSLKWDIEELDTTLLIVTQCPNGDSDEADARVAPGIHGLPKSRIAATMAPSPASMRRPE
jgi:SAM-dependent methyltransferase